MLTLVVSDIFGKTDALEELVKYLPGSKTIVDPYDGVPQYFSSEADAYTAFSLHVGLDTYTNSLADAINEAADPIQLLGFSVGASACWRIAANPTVTAPKQIVGFYGSQIRNHNELKPQCRTTLVFPREEQHFDVQALAQSLEHDSLTDVHRSNLLHGFMNTYSDNFDPDAYESYLAWLQSVLSDYQVNQKRLP